MVSWGAGEKEKDPKKIDVELSRLIGFRAQDNHPLQHPTFAAIFSKHSNVLKLLLQFAIIALKTVF